AFAVAGTPLRGPLYSSPSKRPWIRACGGGERGRCEQRADRPHPWTIRASARRRARHAMKLADPLTLDARHQARFGALDLAGVSADSRAIKRGDLFVAVAGAKDDGLNFVSQAVASGAAAVMAERPPATPLPEGVAFIKVDDARRALALTAAKFFS